jgi:hypothetical protein
VNGAANFIQITCGFVDDVGARIRTGIMNEAQAGGYFSACDYLYSYYREISPVFQRFCLLLRGLACAEPGEDAAHCELGFGQGISVNIHAAANPGQYVGTDFNPVHAENARGLASQAGGNTRLYDDSFAQLLARNDLPEFDSISLHGIWSWITQDNRRVIIDFASRISSRAGSST